MDRKKIFIIDDDVTFLKFLKALFEKENYHVIIDRNSADICNKIKDSRPDIILLDLLLPEENGFQIFKEIKRDEFCASVPVVIITSHQNFSSKLQLLREGVLDYICKPFRKEELLLRMKNYIHYCSNGRKQSVDENLLFNQLKEILSARRQSWIEPQLNRQSQCGYIYNDIRLVYTPSVLGKERDMLEKWADQNLLERVLVDIVKVCPVCAHYHLSLQHICPICGSINIEEVFSQEKSAASFECNDCGLRIKSPQMRFHCLNCDEKFSCDRIGEHKIYKYKVSSLESSTQKDKARYEYNTGMERTNPGSSSPSNLIKTQPNVYFINKRFLSQAFNENDIPHVLSKSFKQRLAREIQMARVKRTDVTVMSVGIENLYQLTMKFDTPIIIKIFKGILHTIVKHLRPGDILSLNDEQHRILVLLPNTHLKMVKIIAEKIQHQLDRFRTVFPLEIKLASYPQDGNTAEEILEMMELGIEKIDSHAFA